MRVLIPAVSAAAELSGVQRHALGLASCLLRVPEISRVDLVVAPWQANMIARHAPEEPERMLVHFENMRNTAVSRNAWFYYGLPVLARRLNVDLVHASYPVPLRRSAFRCPVVVTLHDLYPYESAKNFGTLKAHANRKVLQQCLHCADAIACVSEATVSALKKHAAPSLCQKARRIYNTVELPLVAPRRPVDVPIATPFLLCVAQHRHNKNIDLALRSFHRLLQRRSIDPAMSLVIVGIRGPETPQILRTKEQLGLSSRVVLAEGLSDEALIWCYQHCAALLMPSHTEGFGLPAVEASLVGCKVICSDIPPLREIGGMHCDYVSLGNRPIDAFADAIAASLAKPAQAPVPQPQFSVACLSCEYASFYNDVLAKAGRATASLKCTHIANYPASERSAS